MSAVEEDLDGAGEAAGKPSALRAGTERAPPAAWQKPTTIEGRLMNRLLEALGNPDVEFALWTGERIAPPGVTPVVSIHIKDRGTLYGLVRNPLVRFGDGYAEGSIEIEGDIIKLCETAYRASQRVGGQSKSPLHKLVSWFQKPKANTLDGSRENIHAHYDIGNEFYSLWLGKTMAYTCAYYPTTDATLDHAQESKMHHVCRKLRLRPGESVVEAGFGWGTLALHMAKHYGVKVRAFNISREQVAFARENAKRQGVTSIEYIEDDYRNITGKYDAFVSVGMLEHVGVENYPQLGGIARRSLGSNGRGLIHSIGRNRSQPLHPWIERRIFPGAYPPSLSEFTQIFEPCELSILDVENIRLHYAKTCTHWLELFEASADRVKAMFDENFVRTWRLYLAGSAAAFTTGTLQLFQVVFAPRENNDIPLTREYMYPA